MSRPVPTPAPTQLSPAAHVVPARPHHGGRTTVHASTLRAIEAGVFYPPRCGGLLSAFTHESAQSA